jgi:hypothetical protein
VISDHANVLGFFALFARRSVELDALTFFETLIAVTLDAREMYKDVITLLARDEAESLFCIEKLHCSLCHEYSILNAADRPISACSLERTLLVMVQHAHVTQNASRRCLKSLVFPPEKSQRDSGALTRTPPLLS